MTAPALTAAASAASEYFADDEPVFGTSHELIEGRRVPLFGERRIWPAACIRRPSNRPVTEHTMMFPLEDTGIDLTNLRLREMVFAQLNPTHKALRDRSVFLPAEPAEISTLRQTIWNIVDVIIWGKEQNLRDDLGRWDPQDWQDFLDHQSADATAAGLRHCIHAIRRMRKVAAVLTGITPFDDPWNGKAATHIANETAENAEERRDGLATPSIPPATWWPLLRAAWTYIHLFAPDLLDLRDRLAEDGPPQPEQKSKVNFRTGEEIDELIEEWLARPDSVVPVHARDRQGSAPIRKGEPNWSSLSLSITGGTNLHMFGTGKRAHDRYSGPRREKVLTAIANGTVAVASTDTVGRQAYKPGSVFRRPEEIDQKLRQWLADPNNLVPVRGKADRNAPAGTVVFETLRREVLGEDDRSDLNGRSSKASQRRREWIEEAVARGQVEIIDGSGYRARRHPCPGFAEVTRADGTMGPWRTGITLEELDAELRMVRAACYVFIVAMSAMRDSEIQEIERDAIATFFGSPAVTSRKVKNDPARSHQHWWIIEPVALAIAVAERLSWHPAHIFASITPPKTAAEGKRRHGRRGSNAASDLDYFIERINSTCGDLGLQVISPAHVRPHMFRKTMSLIAGREPDAEIALGLQLKHAARRAVSNRSTPAYGQMDASWATEFDRELEFAAARKLVSLLKDRHRGETIAVGPGAARLHAGLDRVLTTIEADPQLRAQLADETMMATLLHSEFPELHWGTLNHCLFDAPQAECQEGLPEAQRGQGPLLGACQPAKCRNSTITRAHAPIWLAEEKDLVTTLGQKRLAPPRRESLELRLTDVRLITRTFKENGGDL
jgi:integrase